MADPQIEESLARSVWKGFGPFRPSPASKKTCPTDLARFRPDSADPVIPKEEPDRCAEVSARSSRAIISGDEPDRSTHASARLGRPNTLGERARSIQRGFGSIRPTRSEFRGEPGPSREAPAPSGRPEHLERRLGGSKREGFLRRLGWRICEGPIWPTRTLWETSLIYLDRFRPAPVEPNFQGNEPDRFRTLARSAGPEIPKQKPDRSAEVHSSQAGPPFQETQPERPRDVSIRFGARGFWKSEPGRSREASAWSGRPGKS